MENSFLFFMLLFILKSRSQGIPNWVRIDCGSQSSYYDQNQLLWQTDDSFIKTGKNEQISPNSPTPLDQLKTLRAFTDQNKNCYSLPAPTLDRYFFRAMFHYGNYDNLSAPPSFEIEFDGNHWANVEASMTGTVFYEVIYTSKGNNISICLTRTRDRQFPFISMLEAWPLPDNAYSIMRRDVAWIKIYRYNYGVSLILGYPADSLNRVWIPTMPSGVEAVNASFSSLNYTTVDEPPEKAIIETVQANTPGSSIILPPFTFDDLNPLHHVVAYFTETYADSNNARSFNLYVNMDFKFNITPEYQNCTEYMMNIQSPATLNVELIPNFGSTLPPTISAIEIYTGINLLVTGTSQDDLDGLAVLVNSFEQLEGWSGEPCLPIDTVWQWLGCTGTNPPRVNSINLSGYGLKGPIPNFSQMQALESIDLSNNGLNESIPDFLGKLPNLQLLDLRGNLFSGGLPQSITDNKKLTYYVDGNNGNQNLQHQKEKNMALIIGLAVGLPLGLIFLIVLAALAYHFKLKKPKLGNISAAPQEHSQQQNASVTIITEALITPPHSFHHTSNGATTATAPSIECVDTYEEHTCSGGKIGWTGTPDYVNDGIPNQSSMMMQEIDEEELRELLRRHGSSGVVRRS